MTARFTESWVNEILAAGGEKAIAAHAMEEFWQSQRTRRAEYWRHNPIRRVSDERLYRLDNDDDDEQGTSVTPATPGKGRKALAIGVLLAIVAIALEPVRSMSTGARQSLSQTSRVDPLPHNTVSPSCYRILHSVLPGANSRDTKHYASANECVP